MNAVFILFVVFPVRLGNCVISLEGLAMPDRYVSRILFAETGNLALCENRGEIMTMLFFKNKEGRVKVMA